MYGPGGDRLFRRLSGSTIGAEGFHGRVRDGIGCLAPRYGHQAQEDVSDVIGSVCCRVREPAPAKLVPGMNKGAGVWRCTRAVVRCACAHREQADRAISTGQLRGLRPFHLRPIDVMVSHGSWRDLVLRRVSRLDAFSGYPVRT